MVSGLSKLGCLVPDLLHLAGKSGQHAGQLDA